MPVFVYPGVWGDGWVRDEKDYGVSKGTGFTVHRCCGETLHPSGHGNVAFLVGNTGYLLLGHHFKVSQIRDPRNHGRMIPGVTEEWVCLERISDGARRDTRSEVFYDCWEKEPLNAMEVLARVEEEHGMGQTEEDRS